MQLCLDGEMNLKVIFAESQLLLSRPYVVINQAKHLVIIKSHIALSMFQQVFLFILTFFLFTK